METENRSPKDLLMGVQPVIYFSLCQTDNIFLRVGGAFATVDIQEIQPTGSLIQCFLITGRVTVVTV